MSLLHLKIEPTLNASTRKVIIIWYIPKIGYFYKQFSDLSLWWMNGRKLGSIHNLLEKITSIERIIGKEGMMFMNTYMYTNTVLVYDAFSNVVIFILSQFCYGKTLTNLLFFSGIFPGTMLELGNKWPTKLVKILKVYKNKESLLRKPESRRLGELWNPNLASWRIYWDIFHVVELKATL